MGHAWSGLLHRRRERLEWRQLPWYFGLGTVFWAYAQFLLNVFNLPSRGIGFFAWQILLLILPIVLPLILPLAPVPFHEAKAREAGVRWVKPAALVFLGMALVTALLQAVAFPICMWDSLVIYGYKAKILFFEQTLLRRMRFWIPRSFITARIIRCSFLIWKPAITAGWDIPDDRMIRLLFVVYWAAWLGDAL